MRKKWRERIESIERKLNDVDSRSLYGKALEIDKYIECEGCGCLISKNEKHKLPSTVEKQELSVYSPIYQQYPHAYTYSTIKETKEVLKEHYQCGRCRPKEKAK